MPTLVIQPIVENAISHGLERKLGHGRLQLHVMEETNSIQIVIADNGVGMNEQVLADVLSGKERKKYRGGGTGIGLQNVRRRFGIYYGEKGSFHITSSPSIGTEVKITIPIQNRMDDGNHDHS
ncbi:two-component sensor histidine kinase [Geomicrobium sp. JCM 19037]|nr:two-component sensor histidine kinase [Geomicrobium sp. JCM 19037]